jgi:hypothetical protein
MHSSLFSLQGNTKRKKKEDNDDHATHRHPFFLFQKTSLKKEGK